MLAPAFLDELRARTPLPALVGRRVKLSRSGRQWKGCCPFHGEKTPSFYVYDDHFHCFGCGEHGDAVSFVMRGEALGFMEAVTRLAAEAGLDLPAPDPRAEQAQAYRLDLHGVLEAAEAAFARRLRRPEGAAGLAYLRGRGVSEASLDRFGLGWSGEGRGSLRAELETQGVSAAQLLDAGLLRPNEDGSPGPELFFNRVMFPIRDRRGRVISFGGRALGDAPPKYVNGPETALFSKRRQLYGLDLGREALRGTGERPKLIVVEGYMDVIALHQAGFGGAVAPLGTALTEAQLQELWRLSAEPVLCFDGDAAGARAAFRAIEQALPHLTPDHTLVLASLPAGQDPDSLLTRDGRAGFEAVLAAARPLVDALFALLREQGAGPSPEARAGFRARLETAAAAIGHKSLAAEYKRALLDRYFAAYRRGAARPSRAAGRPRPDARATAEERERNLTAILLAHPALLPSVEDAYATLPLSPAHARLREGVFAWAHSLPENEHGEASSLDSQALADHLCALGLSAELAHAKASRPLPLPECAGLGAQMADALAGWWQIFEMLNSHKLDDDVKAAQLAFVAAPVSQARLATVSAIRARRPGGDPDES